MLSARSPSLLDRALIILLESARRVLSLLELEINWKPGKTECFLRYRGSRATHHPQKRCFPGGSLRVAAPGSD
eukprot:2074728-Heterocapsa_arctica.AAC.1